MKTKDIFKTAQEKINAKLGVVKTTAKNTFKVLALAIALTSCDKAEELIPQHQAREGYSVHIYTDKAVVNVCVNNQCQLIGNIDKQEVTVLKFRELKSVSAFIQMGKRFSTSIYFPVGGVNLGYKEFFNWSYDETVH